MYKPVDADVIIVGGGVAGLSAAHFLNSKEPTLNVIILEKSGRIGGRAYSVPLLIGNGRKVSYFDLGAQLVSKEQNQLLQLLDQLGIQYYQPLNKQGKIITYYKRIYTCEKHAKGHFNFFSAGEKFQFAKFIIKVEILSRKLKTEAASTQIKKLQHITLETLINETVKSDAVRAVITHMVTYSCGVQPYQVSALFYIFFCVTTRGICHQLPTENRPLFQLAIKGGTQAIADKITEQIGRDSIVLDEQVTSITQSSRYVEVAAKHTTYRCHAVIVAVTPREVLNITFSPALRQEHLEAIRKTCTTTITNFVATFERDFWQDGKLSGECYFFDKNIYNGPIDYCTSISTPSKTALVGRIFQGKITNDKFPLYRSAVLDQLARCFGERALYPVDYKEKSWTQNYCQMLGWQIGNEKYIKQVRQAYDRIFWAGSETTWEWYGCLAGAVHSGMRAAVEALYIIRPAALNSNDIALITRTNTSQLIPLSNYYGEPVTTLAENWKLITSVCLAALVALWCYKKRYIF